MIILKNDACMSNGYIKHRLLTLSYDVFKNKWKKKEKTDWGHIQVTDTDKNNNDN